MSDSMFSNQKMQLTSEPTSVELFAADQILISINPADLKKMNVSYILINEDCSELLNQYGIQMQLEFEQDGFRIYKIK